MINFDAKAMPERLVRKICFLFLLNLILFSTFAKAQDDSKNTGLSDKQKFEKAIEDAKEIEPDETEKLQRINAMNNTVRVVTAIEAECQKFKKDKNSNAFSNNTVWVSLPAEIRSVFQSRKGEFADMENRLKKLLGLRYDNTYRCLIELEVEASKITRPSSLINADGNLLMPIIKAENERYNSKYPFTNLGYTCDWFYGDGCRYGLTEFWIKPGNGTVIKKACKIKEYLEEKC
jgi:hypothetical protein